MLLWICILTGILAVALDGEKAKRMAKAHKVVCLVAIALFALVVLTAVICSIC